MGSNVFNSNLQQAERTCNDVFLSSRFFLLFLICSTGVGRRLGHSTAEKQDARTLMGNIRDELVHSCPQKN
ncbi:hypothetical protein EYF80_028952 [Liparis tanakae]|uniref:Uncharacterized protein n=1 Tax=Liparis tanakae TaxID=230148 RepID=A0A4Z2H6H4_9TELE|nr:hypothetical protein EYF80_028952 [Liparis tanakae]